MTWPTPLLRELACEALLRHVGRWGLLGSSGSVFSNTTQYNDVRAQKAIQPPPGIPKKLFQKHSQGGAHSLTVARRLENLVILRAAEGISLNLADLTRACAHANNRPRGRSLSYFSQGSAPPATPKHSSKLSGYLRWTSSQIPSSTKQALTRAHTSVLHARRLALAYAAHGFTYGQRGLPSISLSGKLLACNTVVASARDGS
ncbi:hypothetical protein PMIN01_05295 [Paraphaeosphaeria minitans]|uniref:Uncharacterized protein n=1 Tax=Paraphaeosphaeria minitans TaxID=565426 RepID=A0A9P6KT37_9PLEO|nr:hypothetical protein PMIN01_05295 [Paraphaeosphaeria minitans]